MLANDEEEAGAERRTVIGMQHDRRSSSPVRSSRGLLLLKSGDESHTIKEKTGKLTKEEQSQVMKKIIEETKHKKFVEKKR